MTASFYSAPVLVRNYIMLLNEDLMSEFIDNPVITSCGSKTNCKVSLIHRVLNRSIRPGCWARYFIISVSGKDQPAIDRCNRLLERHFPDYRTRKVYKSKTHITLYVNEWLPDNVHLSDSTMRIGTQRSQYGSLDICSPFGNNTFRPKFLTPWKITQREFLGHYQSSDKFAQIFDKSETPPKEENTQLCTSHHDIARFNWPNPFDRYTTFKSVDNEHVNVKLQNKCRRFLEALQNDPHRPETMRVGMDPRSSTVYNFNKIEKKTMPNSVTQKIKPNDMRSSVMMDKISNKEFNFAQKPDGVSFAKKGSIQNKSEELSKVNSVPLLAQAQSSQDPPSAVPFKTKVSNLSITKDYDDIDNSNNIAGINTNSSNRPIISHKRWRPRRRRLLLVVYHRQSGHRRPYYNRRYLSTVGMRQATYKEVRSKNNSNDKIRLSRSNSSSYSEEGDDSRCDGAARVIKSDSNNSDGDPVTSLSSRTISNNATLTRASKATNIDDDNTLNSLKSF